MITETITLGNILTMLTIIIGVVSILIKVSVKITTMSEKLSQMGEKLTTQAEETKTVKNLCADCFIKKQVENLERERERMNILQKELRTQLPLQLEMINKTLCYVKKDVTRIKDGLAKSNFVDIDEGDEK